MRTFALLLLLMTLSLPTWAKPVSDPLGNFTVEIPDDWKKANDRVFNLKDGVAYSSPDKQHVFVIYSLLKKPSEPDESLDDVLKAVVITRVAKGEVFNVSAGSLAGSPGRTFQSVGRGGTRIGATLAKKEKCFAMVALVSQPRASVDSYMKNLQSVIDSFTWLK
jgi:hypothetical protein